MTKITPAIITGIIDINSKVSSVLPVSAVMKKADTIKKIKQNPARMKMSCMIFSAVIFCFEFSCLCGTPRTDLYTFLFFPQPK